MYEKKLAELKRRVDNSKPYESVVAEKEVRRLQSMMKGERKKKLSSRGKKAFEDHIDDLDGNFFEDLDHIEWSDIPPHRRRPCMMDSIARSAKYDERASRSLPSSRGSSRPGSPTKNNMQAVSTEKLLEASLLSLEKLGKQKTTMNNSWKEHEMDEFRSYVSLDNKYPNESYLRGAIWLGRNLHVVVEELNDKIDSLRIKYMSEFSAITGDDAGAGAGSGSSSGRVGSLSGIGLGLGSGDASLINDSRKLNRLQLLITTMLTDVSTEVNRSTIISKDILSKAAQISPGDRETMDSFMRILPIESNLITTSGLSSPGVVGVGGGSKSKHSSRAGSPANIAVNNRAGSGGINRGGGGGGGDGRHGSHGSQSSANSKRLSTDDLNISNSGFDAIAYDSSLADGWI